MCLGYICLWRKSLDSRIFKNSELWKVWSWCLLRASYKNRWISLTAGRGITEVHLTPGQFIFGRYSAAKELGMKPSSVRNRMEKLKNIGNLDIKKDSHYSIVSICNWTRYQPQQEEIGQAGGQPEDSHRTVVGHKQECIKGEEEKREPRCTPPAVRVFKENTNRHPSKSWYSDIAKAVGEKPEDLAFWGNVVHAWVGIGWNPTNVKGMLEYFSRREIPGRKSDKLEEMTLQNIRR